MRRLENKDVVRISKLIETILEVYELRIHEEAEKGTRLTMGVSLQRKMESLKGCYGQLETDVTWIEFRISRNAFYTTAAVKEPRNGPDLLGTLHL